MVWQARESTDIAMARYTGAVRFEEDGELRFFVYDGTIDTARRALYTSPEEADNAWNQALVHDKSTVAHDDLEVAVMPYFCHGDNRVSFKSHADKARTRLTGAVSVEEATRQY